jgi:hypothetical protein
MRSLIPVVALSASLLLLHASGLSQDASSPDFGKFSGRWDGTVTLFQRGQCTASRRGTETYPYEIALTVNEDGSFVGQRLFTSGYDAGKADPTTTLKGQMQPDLSITFTLSLYAICNNQKRTGEIVYSGRLIQKKGKYQLQVEGIDSLCSAMGCVFKQSLDLRKK